MEAVMRELLDDHRNLSRLVNLLESQIDAVHDADPADFDLLRDILRYMTHYPDEVHHPKEDLMIERLLARDPRARPIADQIRREHVALGEKGAAFLAAVERVTDGEMVPREDIERPGRDYVAFLRHHMTVEEGQLFPRARAALADEDWSRVAGEFADRRDPVFGGVVEEQYRELYRFIEQHTP